jgi:hypothetical protein
MKAKIKQIDHDGSLCFVQFSHGERATLDFKPGTEAMKTGQLIVREASETGVVGTLKAENRCDDFLLLTDSDIMKGAKQNRMVNKSLLLAPHSRVLVDVSCVEQSRWRDISDRFEPSQSRVDFSLRAKKASNRSRKGQQGRGTNLQATVWESISMKMEDNQFRSDTMDYDELATHMEMKKPGVEKRIQAAKGCTGLVVIENGKIQCLDIFGREEVYLHYFDGLVKAAFRGSKPIDFKPTEAGRVKQLLNELMDILGVIDEEEDLNYLGAGRFEHLIDAAITGSRLSYGQDLVHMAAFLV